MRWTLLICGGCEHSVRCAPDEVLSRLQNVGVLRREKEPPWHLVSELLPGGADQMACESCGSIGLNVRFDIDLDDWGVVVRSCESCGGRIPAERIEVFPDAKRCANCQNKSQAVELQEDDFCPWCGGLMTVKTRSSDMTRYVSYCPTCRK